MNICDIILRLCRRQINLISDATEALKKAPQLPAKPQEFPIDNYTKQPPF